MPEHESEVRYPSDLVPRLARIIHGEHFPTGDRARLKRMGIGGPTPLSYYRFKLRHVPEQWQGEDMALAWRTLISGLAMQHRDPHRPTPSLGGALADCGYSELRLESLLAASDRVLAVLVLRAARRLAAHWARCDWRELAWLLFARDFDTRERINRRIAHAYYRTAHTTDGDSAATN